MIKNKLYRCKKCNFYYKDKNLAKRCYEYCKKHKSCSLEITKHAGEKMLIEGISVQKICEALERGAKFEQTEGLLAKYTYFSVAYKKVGDKYRIKTVFINR